MSESSVAFGWIEQGLVPDSVIRAGIRRLVRRRLSEIEADDAGAAAERTEVFVASMRDAPVALVPEAANRQHYEIPPQFYRYALGSRRKYSSCYWPDGVDTLDEAEVAALSTTCDHAQLADGQRVLELGCGWGSLTLWVAERYPATHITAVSNSHSQREYVLAEAARRNLSNVTVVTGDMNDFDTGERFDRVVSIEMFEHMRNWGELLRRVCHWLEPGGKFFMHVFAHRSVPYAFEVRDASDWMSRHFFTGGMMPSDDLALRFQDHLKFMRRWRWDGTHYEKTASAWLANVDRHRAELLHVLAEVYGAQEARYWLQRWRIFFMACAELFGYERGQQWWVSHYLFERPAH